MIIDIQNIQSSPGYSRIISLVPSQTELLYSLGLDIEVIGITKFCVHPAEWHQTKPKVGGTKNIHIKTIHDLQPDLVIANYEENVKEQVEALAATINVFVTDVNDLGGAMKMIMDIGNLSRRKEKASRLVHQIKHQFQQLQDSILLKRKINTAYLIWQNPYMTVGGDTFINDMMLNCGLENVFSYENRYPEISIGDIRKNNCELIILSSEPYPFKERHLGELKEQLPGIKIVLADGEMFSWYGSRLLQAAPYFKNFRDHIEHL